MTLLHDVLKAFENSLPLHVAVQIAMPSALEAAWQQDDLADVLGVRFRLGLTPRDDAALVAMVARVIEPSAPGTRAWVSGGDNPPAEFILERLREYLADRLAALDLEPEVSKFRQHTRVANWSHPAEAAYHTALAIGAREKEEAESDSGMLVTPRIWHLYDALSLVKDELSTEEKLHLEQRLRADLQIPTAAEIFAATVGERRTEIVW